MSLSPGDNLLSLQVRRRSARTTPVPSLSQMLYKRAGAKKIFSRDKEGKYGLLSWHQTAKPVPKKAAPAKK